MRHEQITTKRRLQEQERERDLRARERKLQEEAAKFKEEQERKAAEKQEEMFNIDYEREMDRRNKDGRVMRTLRVRPISDEHGCVERGGIGQQAAEDLRGQTAALRGQQGPHPLGEDGTQTES